MLLEQHLLQLFGNLPYLPKVEITKHLDDVDLIKAFLMSENWDDAVKCRQNRESLSRLLSMRSKQDRIELSVSVYYYPKSRGLLIDFPVESALENSTEIVEGDEGKNRVIFHSENFKQFEDRVLTIFHKIQKLFSMKIAAIQVNLDLGLNLGFLKKLRLEKFGSFELSGDKKNCRIRSKQLNDLMDTWEIEGSIRIKIETIGKFKGNSEMLSSCCEFTDSRWMTGEMFNEFDGWGARFKRCLLSSEDFNQSFVQWRKKKKKNFYNLEFYMGHELDVEKVLEGLEAKKWNPKKRGRIFKLEKFPSSNSSEFYRLYGERGYTFIDCADGMDISRHGKLATIHISTDKKVLKFLLWSRRFPLQEDKKHFTTMIDHLKPKLDQFVWSPRELAKIAKEVEDYEAKLQAVDEQIDRENQLSMN